MSNIIFKDMEVTIVGCTFIVDYRISSGLQETLFNPEDPKEVEILTVSVKGQPDADADMLLEAIKVSLNLSHSTKSGIRFENGYDLLTQEILESDQYA
jgi:hypothetical protein